jgi:hypothetical protein
VSYQRYTVTIPQIWYGMVWYGMVWYGSICGKIPPLENGSKCSKMGQYALEYGYTSSSPSSSENFPRICQHRFPRTVRVQAT